MYTAKLDTPGRGQDDSKSVDKNVFESLLETTDGH